MSDLDWLTSARDLCPEREGDTVTLTSRGRSVTLTTKSRAVIVARIGEVMREKMNGGRRE